MASNILLPACNYIHMSCLTDTASSCELVAGTRLVASWEVILLSAIRFCPPIQPGMMVPTIVACGCSAHVRSMLASFPGLPHPMSVLIHH